MNFPWIHGIRRIVFALIAGDHSISHRWQIAENTTMSIIALQHRLIRCDYPVFDFAILS
jgi:hypothetical protein